MWEIFADVITILEQAALVVLKKSDWCWSFYIESMQFRGMFK